VQIVDWERRHARDPGDIEALVRDLRLELIRDSYWGLELPEHVYRKAHKRRPSQLQTSAERILVSSLRPNHFREGRQTPFAYAAKEGATIINCAQHATATCCRACLEKWYGHPRATELTAPDFDFLSKVMWRFIDERLVSLDSYVKVG
jgi:hypothetical protein